MHTLWQDIRYGMRMLWKRPSFTLVAIITLALGIGANTAIFSVVNAFLLRPLPFGAPEQLVMVQSRQGAAKKGISIPDFQDLRAQNDVFADLAFMEVPGLANVRFGSEVETLSSLYTTSNLFNVLQVKPILGRTLLPEDDQSGATKTVVLSYGLWTRRFGADKNVLNRQLQIGSEICTIVGVMPPNFNFPSQTHLWMPNFSTCSA